MAVALPGARDPVRGRVVQPAGRWPARRARSAAAAGALTRITHRDDIRERAVGHREQLAIPGAVAEGDADPDAEPRVAAGVLRDIDEPPAVGRPIREPRMLRERHEPRRTTTRWNDVELRARHGDEAAVEDLVRARVPMRLIEDEVVVRLIDEDALRRFGPIGDDEAVLAVERAIGE